MSPENDTQIQVTQPQPRNEVIVQDALSMISNAHSGERDQMILLRAKLDYAQRLAKMFAFSGCFADIKDQREEVAIAKALVKIKLGESMGFSEAEAMTGIDIIQGRVAVGASLRAARMQRAGYSWPQMICTDKGCWIPLVFQGQPMMQQQVDEKGKVVLDRENKPVMVQVIVSFDLSDATKAGLASKDNYRKDPSSMYFARAITRAQRRYGPGVLGVDMLDTYEARDLDDQAPIQMIGRETVAEHDARLDEKMQQQAQEDEPQPTPTTETKAEEKTGEPTETSDPTPINIAAGAQWRSIEGMEKAYMAQLEALGEQEFYAILGQNSISGKDDMQLSNPATVTCFLALKAAVAAKAPKEEAPTKTLKFGRKDK